jgi:hypothetical protein
MVLQGRVDAAAFLVFELGSVCAAGMGALALMLGGASLSLFFVPPALIAPFLAASLVAGVPGALAQKEERAMLREAPAVVGYLTMSMQLQPSLERAVAFAGDHGPGVLPTRLRGLSWSLLTRGRESIEAGVQDLASSLSDMNENLRQALHLTMSATSEGTKAGMDRLLDKANALVIDGVKDAVEGYVASLTLPTMVLFSFGILLPVLLFSMVPLLSLSVTFDPAANGEQLLSPGIPLLPLALLLLVLLPGVSFVYSIVVVGRSPTTMPESAELHLGSATTAFLAVWLSGCALLITLGFVPSSPNLAVLAMTLPLPLFLFARLRKDRPSRPSRTERRSTVSALYQIGNRMTAGASFESALSASARPGTRFSWFAGKALHRWRTSRGGIELALQHSALQEASPMVHSALLTVAECARRDSVAAGKIALNLAQYLSDLDSCEERIESRLKGVVDMMRSTALIFAPIVLGITTSLLRVIGAVQPMAGLESSIQLMTGIYVAELCFVVAYFTTFLVGEKSWKEVGYQFGVRAPVAEILFIAVSASFQSGLTQLL